MTNGNIKTAFEDMIDHRCYTHYLRYVSNYKIVVAALLASLTTDLLWFSQNTG